MVSPLPLPEAHHDEHAAEGSAMMTLHKLSAGNGYTYLTRQVAANDVGDTDSANLGEYYSERGESPGVWLCRGLAGLDDGPHVVRRRIHALVASFRS